MDSEIRTTDAKARVTLPRSFAETTVIVERISEGEVRIRKAVVLPQDDLRFQEEAAGPLSDRDRDLFLSLLDRPPEPSEALRRAARRNPRRG